MYDGDRLTLYILDRAQSPAPRYRPQPISPTFPELEIIPLIETALRDSQAIGRSPTLRQIRSQVRSQIDP